MPLITHLNKAEKNSPNGNNFRPAINKANNTYTKQISGLNSAAGNNQFTRISTAVYNGTPTAERGINTLNQTPPAGGTLPGSK
jgi:hypothetical protein